MLASCYKMEGMHKFDSTFQVQKLVHYVNSLTQVEQLQARHLPNFCWKRCEFIPTCEY